MNALAALGAALGLLSLFATWRYLSFPLGDFESSALQELRYSHHSITYLLIGGVIFAAGSIASVFRTYGAIAQSMGLGLYFVGYLDWKGGVDIPGWKCGLGTGFWMALFSILLVVGGAIFAVIVKIQFAPGTRALADRSRTLRVESVSAGETAGEVIARRRQFNTGRFSPTAVALIVILSCIFAGVTVISEAPDHKVEEVDGGIVWILDFQYRPWNISHVMIHDNHSNASGNISFAHWTLENSGLNPGVWSAYTGNVSTFGEDNISMTIVDSTGNGIADYGDAIIFVMSGQSFRSDRTYFAFITDGRTIAWSGWELKFTFKSGNLASYSVSRVLGL